MAERSVGAVREALLRAGVVVVMNRGHVRTPEHLVTTMWEVYQAGYVAECTFRIDEGIIREGMQELVKRRDAAPADKPFVLGVGSIINPSELEAAIAMGFDMAVAPADIEAAYENEWEDIVVKTREAGVFLAPAGATPTELSYFLERDDGLEPDAIKIFPAQSASHVGTLLAPFVRDRHSDKIIMPTGGVDATTGPKFQEAIIKAGFLPALGMSAPLALVSERGLPGDLETIQQSLAEFRQEFQPYVPT